MSKIKHQAIQTSRLHIVEQRSFFFTLNRRHHQRLNPSHASLHKSSGQTIDLASIQLGIKNVRQKHKDLQTIATRPANHWNEPSGHSYFQQTMKPANLTKYVDAFRSVGVEPPSAYIWIAGHGMVGFEEFSQAEPWFFCGIEEILPLHKRWSNFKEANDYVPFARMQGQDELACFKLDNHVIVGIRMIHYSLGVPTSWEFGNEYKDTWDWLKAIVSHIELWCRIKNQQG